MSSISESTNEFFEALYEGIYTAVIGVASVGTKP
jgi:hypothetical protein